MIALTRKMQISHLFEYVVEQIGHYELKLNNNPSKFKGIVDNLEYYVLIKHHPENPSCPENSADYYPNGKHDPFRHTEVEDGVYGGMTFWSAYRDIFNSNITAEELLDLAYEAEKEDMDI
jgi:hypothetical protein